MFALTLLQVGDLPPQYLGAAEAVQLVKFHLAFNLVLVLLALPFVRSMERLATLILPDPAVEACSGVIEPIASIVDRALVGNPTVELASAKREPLCMGETEAVIYHPVMELVVGGNLDKIARERALVDEVNRKCADNKVFIVEANRCKLTEREPKLGRNVQSARQGRCEYAACVECFGVR